MSERENKQELRGKLIRAKDIEEVRAILGPETAEEEINQTWREIEAHRPAEGLEAVDDDELEAVSGGIRDWETEGCSNTTKKNDVCWVDDMCVFAITWYYAFDPCTDGRPHDWYQAGTGYEKTITSKRKYRIFACRKCNTKEKRYDDGNGSFSFGE